MISKRLWASEREREREREWERESRGCSISCLIGNSLWKMIIYLQPSEIASLTNHSILNLCKIINVSSILFSQNNRIFLANSQHSMCHYYYVEKNWADAIQNYFEPKRRELLVLNLKSWLGIFRTKPLNENIAVEV